MTPAEALHDIRTRIERAANRAGRDPEDVDLVAVSKGMPDAAILDAYRAGHRVFGENRVAELAGKAGRLPADIEWHFVGSIQRRKLKDMPPVTAIHSLDRMSLARSLVERDPCPPCYVQVNVSGEPAKHGFAPDELEAALTGMADLGLSPVGLMTMPPLPERAEDSRPWFRDLAGLRRRFAGAFPSLTGLSMGMTDDFEVAVEEGATVVRVGRAIFEASGEG